MNKKKPLTLEEIVFRNNKMYISIFTKSARDWVKGIKKH